MTVLDQLTGGLRQLPAPVADLSAAAAVGVLAGADAAVNDAGHRQADQVTWLLLALSLVALVWRRRWPLPVAGVTGAACAGWALYGHIGELLNLPVMLALYTVAVLGDRRRTVCAGVAAALVSGAVALRVGPAVNPQGLLFLEVLWPLVPLLLGEAVRMRRQLLRAYAARAARAEEDREREAARRVREERVRMARELHDIVAHTVTAMTVQAGVALDAFDVRPEVSRRAMRQVRESGKEAVRELRTAVTVLRDGEGGAVGPVPGPGPGSIDDLVSRFAESGPHVTLRGEGAAASGDGMPAAAGLAAYRIVQEALTNAVRHANARQVTVTLVREEGQLVVEVVDDGPPAEERGRHAAAGGGMGLIGMRERAQALGGSLDHGPVPGGGFRVRALLPADDDDSGRRG
ncbi:sensor histidine kinase [Streptomyces sp. NPDC050703]|uniref:sensor histidine kinase n=1 Tax=Streptomyces sp. NPDC050703 TaxID=3157218 RepID=UPI00344A62A0